MTPLRRTGAQLWLRARRPRPEVSKGLELVMIVILMSTYPFKHGKDNLDNLDDGPEDPDVEDGEQGEDDGPDHGQGEHEDCGDESVEPELGLTEQDERQSPQGIEPVRRAGLG